MSMNALFCLCIGCQLLVYPGAFNMTTGPAHWELLARARAVDNQCYVATVSPARDVTASYVAWGHSLIVNPWYVYSHKLHWCIGRLLCTVLRLIIVVCLHFISLYWTLLPLIVYSRASAWFWDWGPYRSLSLPPLPLSHFSFLPLPGGPPLN